MLLRYIGPHTPGVEIPALGLEVERGVPFEVVDEGAAMALLAQASNFELVDADAAPAAADPTPAADPDPEV